jgi:hypothetical protein
MNPEIQKILNDIYEADPGLRGRELEIMAIVEDLVRARPDTQFDENFRARLRAEIMRRAGSMDASAPDIARNKFVWLQRLAFVAAGAAICALIVLPLAYNRQGLVSGVHDLLAGKKTAGIERLGDQAFGSLALGTISGSGGQTASMEKDSAANAAARQSVTLVAPAATPAADYSGTDLGMSVSGEGGGSSGSAGKVSPGSIGMPVYYENNYTFVYKGENFSVSDSKMDVLKRNKNAGAPQLGSLLSGSGLNMVDWTRYASAKIQNVSFVTDGDKGYAVNANFIDGSVSISQNWPSGGYAIMRDATVISSEIAPDIAYRPLKMANLPADDKIIAAANKFLSDFGISVAGYGEPFVQNDWRLNYESQPDAASIYVPDSLTVIYPLKINNKDVFDESGNKSGLFVNVNVRDMIATGVWELASQQYQSSAYDTEKDAARLINIAENGGFRQYRYFVENNGNVKQVELGTPALAYVRLWIYKDNVSEELFVPAYIFPITKKPAGIYLYQKNIIVPVIKDVLEQDNQVPVAVPMEVKTSPASVR